MNGGTAHRLHIDGGAAFQRGHALGQLVLVAVLGGGGEAHRRDAVVRIGGNRINRKADGGAEVLIDAAAVAAGERHADRALGLRSLHHGESGDGHAAPPAALGSGVRA
jgi:hypothetical protein